MLSKKISRCTQTRWVKGLIQYVNHLAIVTFDFYFYPFILIHKMSLFSYLLGYFSQKCDLLCSFETLSFFTSNLHH